MIQTVVWNFFFEKRVSTFLNSKKLSKYLLKFEKDTLITGGDLVVDVNGAVQKEKSYVAIKGMKLNKKLKTAFRELFYNTIFQKVLFYKNAPNTSVHPFYFKYVVTKTEGIPTIVLVENDKPYKGGVIREVPKFPGCEGLPSEQAKLCFQTQIERHIKEQFKYPPLAFEKGISGTVSIVFTISKEGKVRNIRTKGPDPLLEDEARRLVKLLPRFQPALENGIPVKIPFSIPIYFNIY